jgi:hypothetical protein
MPFAISFYRLCCHFVPASSSVNLSVTPSVKKLPMDANYADFYLIMTGFEVLKSALKCSLILVFMGIPGVLRGVKIILDGTRGRNRTGTDAMSEGF